MEAVHAFAHHGKESDMLFNGIAYPDQLTVLTTALEDYCRSNHVEPGTPAYEDAARLIMQLFNNGAFTPAEISAALDATAREGA